MTVKNLKEFLYENYYKKIGFTKEDSYYPLKSLEKKIY